MTREEAMLKLLALEPERQDRLVLITGWGEAETLWVLAALKADRRAQSIVAEGHRTWFIPGANDAHLQHLLRDRATRQAREARRGSAGRHVANGRRKASPEGPR